MWRRQRGIVKTADPQTDWERLFLSRCQRRVRLDATISLEGSLWEVPVHLRGRLIQVRFDPFAWQRVEIWLENKYAGLARRCDEQLLPRLQMGINAPLLARLSFCLELQPWSPEDLQGYLQARLQEAGIHSALFEESAHQLLLQAAHGLPRVLNHLAQRAIEQAAGQNSRSVSSVHVQSALQLMPWLTKL